MEKYEVWFSDRIVVDEKGFMRVCQKLKFDKSLARKINFNQDTIKLIEDIQNSKPPSPYAMFGL